MPATSFGVPGEEGRPRAGEPCRHLLPGLGSGYPLHCCPGAPGGTPPKSPIAANEATALGCRLDMNEVDVPTAQPVPRVIGRLPWSSTRPHTVVLLSRSCRAD